MSSSTKPRMPPHTPQRSRRLEVKEAQASAWARAVVAEEVRARAAGRLEAAEQESEHLPLPALSTQAPRIL
jgi:hypothetical protein